MDLFIKVCSIKNIKLIYRFQNNNQLLLLILFLGPNGSSKTASLSRKGSKEKLSMQPTSVIVTVVSPQISPGPSISDEMPEETKSDLLRRTNSSSSIVTLGMSIYFILIRHNFKSTLLSFRCLSNNINL